MHLLSLRLVLSQPTSSVFLQDQLPPSSDVCVLSKVLPASQASKGFYCVPVHSLLLLRTLGTHCLRYPSVTSLTRLELCESSQSRQHL